MLRAEVPHHSTGRSAGLLHREAQRASRSKEVPQAEDWAHHEGQEVGVLPICFMVSVQIDLLSIFINEEFDRRKSSPGSSLAT